VIRRLLLPAAVLGAWFVAAALFVASASSVAGSVEDVDQEQLRLEHQLRNLRREHRALQEWVADELRPWLIERTEEQTEALPPDAQPPSAEPLPPVPPEASSSPPPSPASSPSGDSPSESPSPSEVCIPLIDVCI
jgi:hypothetical protein